MRKPSDPTTTPIRSISRPDGGNPRRIRPTASARTMNTKGSASTWGCMSPSRKEKNGNSSITSMEKSPILSWTTREARHHHQLSVGTPPVRGAAARFLTSIQFQNASLPRPRLCSSSSSPSRFPMPATKRDPRSPYRIADASRGLSRSSPRVSRSLESSRSVSLPLASKL